MRQELPSLKMLLCIGYEKDLCTPVKDIVVCDSKGIISKDRLDIKINPAKAELAKLTNRNNVKGTLADAMKGADVFIGVSVANALGEQMVRSMNKNP